MGTDSDIIQEIKNRLDIVEIVRRYVDLKPVSGRWVGPCPFHQETKGSFSVNPEGFYYCFGCQAAGDVIDFYRKMNGLEFRETLEALAAEAGVELKNSRPDPQADKKKKLRKSCYAMHTLAGEYFRNNLNSPEGRPAREYLGRRELSREIIEKFHLGYSLDQWQGLQDFLCSKGFSPDMAVAAGLISKNDKGRTYDRFRGRLIFPISDVAGRIIAFGGRVIGDGDPKYLNSSDSPIYKKGEHLYGLHQARPAIAKSKRALLTEGYVDVLSLHQFGYPDAVGVLGTALTPEQVRRLGGFCSKIDLVFDGDAAGRKAALRSAEMILAEGLTCRVVLLPEGQDVDELLHEKGKEGFDSCLDEALDGLTFCLSEIRATGSAREVIDWAKNFVRRLRDASWRAYFIPRLAQGLGLVETELQTVLGSSSKPSAPKDGDKPVRQKKHAPIKTAEQRDRQFLGFVIRNPQYIADCDALGLEFVLETGWAREFWYKIRNSQGSDIIQALDENEKSFWAQERSKPAPPDDVLQDAWIDTATYIQKLAQSRRIENLEAALEDAQLRGDKEEVLNLLQAINAETLGRVDEQS